MAAGGGRARPEGGRQTASIFDGLEIYNCIVIPELECISLM